MPAGWALLLAMTLASSHRRPGSHLCGRFAHACGRPGDRGHPALERDAALPRWFQTAHSPAAGGPGLLSPQDWGVTRVRIRDPCGSACLLGFDAGLLQQGAQPFLLGQCLAGPLLRRRPGLSLFFGPALRCFACLLLALVCLARPTLADAGDPASLPVSPRSRRYRSLSRQEPPPERTMTGQCRAVRPATIAHSGPSYQSIRPRAR